MFPAQDVRVGGRQGRSQYQFTLWSSDLDELLNNGCRRPGASEAGARRGRCLDRPRAGRIPAQCGDRPAAAARATACACRTSTAALANAYAQRQISTIYTQRNQYRVILEVDPLYQRDPTTSRASSFRAAAARRCRCPTWRKFERSIAPLVINHQGQFPAVTISLGLKEGVALDAATARHRSRRCATCSCRTSSRPSSPATRRHSRQSAGAQPLLILAALIAIYIVLGVLYESLAHPLTIISTLPSAGLGALLALQIFGADLTIIAFIGIILLIGHREEERHHAGRLRARSRAPARACRRSARSTRRASSASGRS